MTATESRHNGHQEPDDIAALRREIARTRADLGATVEALAAKADVKARAHDAVAEVKARANQKVGDIRVRANRTVGQTTGRLRGSMTDYPRFWAAGALAGAMVLMTTVFVRRRRNH